MADILYINPILARNLPAVRSHLKLHLLIIWRVSKAQWIYNKSQYQDQTLTLSAWSTAAPSASHTVSQAPDSDPVETFLYHMQQTSEGSTVAAELGTSISIDTLIQDFQDGKMVTVSDGSYFKDFDMGAAEWILISEDDSEYIIGGGVCPWFVSLTVSSDPCLF